MANRQFFTAEEANRLVMNDILSDFMSDHGSEEEYVPEASGGSENEEFDDQPSTSTAPPKRAKVTRRGRPRRQRGARQQTPADIVIQPRPAEQTRGINLLSFRRDLVPDLVDIERKATQRKRRCGSALKQISSMFKKRSTLGKDVKNVTCVAKA
uniref:uncharacterized protein LOC120344509 n=1 Tax=Styela clava TaxID=7725 RepID=UPI001939F91E|nr:uncharacterized protein LOC120344509 [Styela clava]